MKSNSKEAEAAFGEVYSRFSNRIYAYCFRVTDDSNDANDLFQETFLSFFNSISDIKDSQGRIFPYLLKIARNLCLNSKRTVRNFVNISEIDEYSLVTENKNYENEELLELIAKALDCLEFEYREVFVLRQYQGLSYIEIAELNGESVTAVKNRYWRAKDKIKDILQPYLNDLTKAIKEH